MEVVKRQKQPLSRRAQSCCQGNLAVAKKPAAKKSLNNESSTSPTQTTGQLLVPAALVAFPKPGQGKTAGRGTMGYGSKIGPSSVLVFCGRGQNPPMQVAAVKLPGFRSLHQGREFVYTGAA